MDLLDSQHADELSTLLALAENGSFASAGRAQNRHPSVLSKRLNALERRLGVRLVERTTRQLRLTDEGIKLVEKVRQATNLLADAQIEASAGAAQVRGRLRISMPAVLGRQCLSPIVAEFSLSYPEILLDIEYTDRMVDIVGERFDAAIRVGQLSDSRLVATKLCQYQRILGASRAYLERNGTPRTPTDLARHNCLGFVGLASHPEWKMMHATAGYRKQSSSMAVAVHGTMVSNDNEALLTAAMLGVGIVVGGDWLLNPHIAAGALVHVLPHWQVGATGGIYFVRPSGKFITAAMAAFRQWMVERVSSCTWLGMQP
jgi:DNA-binding transcriptional LysR family regulator